MQIESQSMRRFKEAFRIAVAVTIAMFVFRFFNVPKGNWIVLTVGVIYMGGSAQGIALRRANERIAGTALGLTLAFLFVSILMVHEYRFVYILPFIWFAMSYLMQASPRYIYSAMCVSMFVPILLVITTSDPNELNFNESLFERLLCTGIGAAIVFFSELVIFPKATSAISDINRISRQIYEDIAMELEMIVEHFAEGREIRNNSWMLNSEIFGKFGTTETLYRSLANEIGSDVRKNEAYEEHFKILRDVGCSLKILTALCNNIQDRNMADEDRKALAKAAETISSSFMALRDPQNLQNTAQGPIAGKIKELLENTSYGREKLIPQAFFLEQMESAAKSGDELHDLMKTITGKA